MQKVKRQRGIILTYEGLQQLEDARQQSESEHNNRKRYTFEQLASITQLDINTIKKVLACEEGVDKRTMENIFTAFNIQLTQNYFSHSPLKLRVDLGEAPCTDNFCGRLSELELLQNWLLHDRCRLVAILGMGGIGKTSLSVKLAEQLEGKYEYIIWRSLREAPSAKTIVANLIQFLSDEEETEASLPESLNQRLAILLKYLRNNRCLLILDNAESILRSGARVGEYREGYEDYGELIRILGEASHNSCLVLTSREKPKEIAMLEGDQLPTRSLPLEGLSSIDGEEVLKVKGICGVEGECKAVVELYTGNPMALKIVATEIKDLFNGNVNEFLENNTIVLGNINELLESQFERLSDLEKEIIYWLAINREPVGTSELEEDIVSDIPRATLLDILGSLIRRSLVEKIDKLSTLQPVVMEYVTNKFIDKVVKEIDTQNIDLFKCNALMKATAKDYVEDAQVRLILEPIVKKLLLAYKGQLGLELHLTQILAVQQKTFPLEPGYLAGNIINILCKLGTNLKGYDFSNLTIRQADLRRVQLHNVNFANSDLTKSVFAEAFGGIISVAFSPDGKLLAIGDTSGNIILRQVADGKQILSWKGHTNWITSLAFSPNGKVIASASSDCIVRLWDVSTSQCFKTLQGHNNEVWSVTFSPDSNTLVTGSLDHTIRLWNINTGECERIFLGHTNWVLSVTFSPNGQMLASGSDDNTIKLWSIDTGECERILLGHRDGIRTVSFSPDGQTLASGSDDSTIKLWNVSNGECLETFQNGTGGILSVSFSPKGDFLASGSYDQMVKIWSIKTGECLKTLGGHASWVYSVAFSLQGDILASGSYDQTVKVWSVITGECLKTFQGHTNQVLCVTFSPDGKKLASSGYDKVIRLWSVSTGECLTTLQGHRAAIQSVAFSPNNQMLASGSHDSSVKLWDANTGQLLRTFQGHTNQVLSVVFSPDSQMLATGSFDQTVRVWDVSTGQTLKKFQGHSAGVTSVAFNPTGTVLASGAVEQTFKLWDIYTDQCAKTVEGHTSWAWSIAFSPNGELLASASYDGTLRLWCVRTGECLRILQAGTGWLYSVVFSPDSRMVASCSQDNTVKLWDVSTGQHERTFQGHTARIWSVAFSPDNKILASSGEDETIRLSDVATGECLKILEADKLYKHMNITGVTGLTQATIGMLKLLGAVELITTSSNE